MPRSLCATTLGREEASRLEDVKSQLYDRAVDLYIHEDQLNWIKLNNLFYVTGGLLAVLGFTVSIDDGLLPLSSVDAAVILIVSAFGLLTSTIFGVALHFGVKYLLLRKTVVMRIEGCLTEERDFWVVTPRSKDGSDMRVSPTSKLLRVVPYLVATGWGSLIVLALIA